MATRDRCNGGTTLPGVVPFDSAPLSRLSWELGSRVVDDDESARLGRWVHVDSSRTLTLFQVTGETVVIRVRTPIGRERFYGAALMDLPDVRPALDDAPSWNRAA
ncbi:hypothetical protein [Haloplanus aerogenes]|uniref:Uncharacterized protein n=1 Tax=Haloplanus aerogenes TaxID=660522 RepID=A0A3M0CXC7_9EURY|nr:hypothetical protein [Haloplanus aerogenes]AZH24972.1 hypothetical protein DU502_06125 [Haloplanus aerogenes]RMB13811.1 hypothetical protein ATH50_2253 [Haloplanus aerogenes]